MPKQFQCNDETETIKATELTKKAQQKNMSGNFFQKFVGGKVQQPNGDEIQAGFLMEKANKDV